MKTITLSKLKSYQFTAPDLELLKQNKTTSKHTQKKTEKEIYKT